VRLPAVATITAIAASAPVTAAPASSTTAVAATSAATTAAASATASSAVSTAAAPATPTTAAFGLGLGFIDHEIASAEILAIERGDGFLGVCVTRDFHEGETARLARKTIADEGYG
jgi:hypothetical protein